MILGIIVLPLLIFLSLYVPVILTKLANAPVIFFADALPFILYLILLFSVYLSLKYSKYSGNIGVPSLIMTLCGIGMIIQMRVGILSIGLSLSQLVYPISVLVMMATYFICRNKRINYLEKYWFPILLMSVLVILFVLLAGRKYRGAVYLPGNINPVEIVKPLLIICISSILAGHSKLLSRGIMGIPLPPMNIIATVGIVWVVPMALLMIQGDLGMFALMNATLIVMLYAATKRVAYFVFGMTSLVALARILIPLTSRGKIRFEAWQDPFSYATSAGWQQLQGLVALYSGGLFGSGFGAGTPTVVPIVESDFVYIVLGEELGFIGCVVILLIYLAFIISCMRVAENTDKSSVYGRTIATGITACFAIQIILNIGGVTTFIPLTGIPLPLLSHGGSSLITSMFMAGLLLAISDTSHQGAELVVKKTIKRKKSRVSKSKDKPKKKTKKTK